MTATLEVFETLEEGRETIPRDLYALVAAAADVPEVEDHPRRPAAMTAAPPPRSPDP